ncbi:MAG: type B 50S ribosomal protein L31 [Bacteroidetes bacterium]|jgi:large subunit ribosomal protein L31|nr:type B 50S ribosomal protein L31 [Bacteroidota bacterium]
MKKGIHPEYKEVVFKDVSSDFTFIGKSTIKTRETIQLDGTEYPLVKLDISSRSHPYFTGKQQFVDTAGRVDKFFARYGKNKK